MLVRSRDACGQQDQIKSLEQRAQRSGKSWPATWRKRERRLRCIGWIKSLAHQLLVITADSRPSRPCATGRTPGLLLNDLNRAMQWIPLTFRKACFAIVTGSRRRHLCSRFDISTKLFTSNNCQRSADSGFSPVPAWTRRKWVKREWQRLVLSGCRKLPDWCVQRGTTMREKWK